MAIMAIIMQGINFLIIVLIYYWLNSLATIQRKSPLLSRLPKLNFMKSIFSILAILTVILSFQSCKDKCTGTRTYIKYTPVYMSYGDLRNSVASQSPRLIINPGKIYVYG